MSKYSSEFKLEIVKYCINEHLGHEYVAKLFGVNHESLRKWIKKYQKFGYSGLIKNINQSYSGDFKIAVVEYMHKNNLSLSETCIQFNLGSHSVVSKWERIYYEEGPQTLELERRGRSKKLNSKQTKKLSESTEKDLIAEIQQLRMENAYLKKLNALVQERIKRENPKWY